MRAARRLSALSLGSVMAMTCSASLSLPTLASSSGSSVRNWVSVSAVVPDLEMTIRPVRADGDRRGYVIAIGETSTQALARAELAATRLEVEVA